MPPQAREWVPRGAQNLAQIGREILLRPAVGPLPPRRQLPCCPRPRACVGPRPPSSGCGQTRFPSLPSAGQLLRFPFAAPVLTRPFQPGYRSDPLHPTILDLLRCLTPTAEWASFRASGKPRTSLQCHFHKHLLRASWGARSCAGRSGSGAAVCRSGPRPEGVGGHLVSKQCSIINVISGF